MNRPEREPPAPAPPDVSGASASGIEPDPLPERRPHATPPVAAVRAARLHAGMAVVGSDGVSLGKVKETSDTDFLVDRPLHPDTYVPLDAILEVGNGRVVLNLPAGQVDSMGWPTP